MLDLFNFTEGYTLAVVATGAALLGIISGAIGCLSVLKRQSLLADAVSHASLPGIVIAFIITGAKTQSVLLAGAAAVGWLAAFQVFTMMKKSSVRQDSLLSLVLSVYFGFGMVLLSYVQHKPGASQAGIESFLFGQAATMLISDVQAIILILLWKELTLLIFDPVFAASAGYPVMVLELIFSLLLVGSIVIGLQTVGVVLMSAMLIAPAVAARQWTNNFKIMIVIASVFGGVSGITGSIFSSFMPSLPTGPAIIIIISLITFFSILFAPKRGLVWRHMRSKAAQASADSFAILDVLYLLSLQHTDELHGHPAKVIKALFPLKKDIDQILKELYMNGFAVQVSFGEWAITPQGKDKVIEMMDTFSKNRKIGVGI